MCGITGAWGGPPEPVARMTRALAHRGPDDEGLWSDPERPVHLGHRRLAVIDPETGFQPMWTADRRLGIVFNGEIYNHAELRRRLEERGHRFQSDHSDTEVLLHGYREWGETLLEQLNGMWAFALYDRDREELWLSRDRFGQKPLYWSFRSGVFAFASEASALLMHPSVGQEPSTKGLQKYFAYGYAPAPHTIYRDVHKLPAGCMLRYAEGKTPSIRRYWEFLLEPEEPVGDDFDESTLEPLRERLLAAVERRLVADVPIGVFLSGGIDSTSIAFAAQTLSKFGSLRSFSIGFQDPSFDESGHAEAAAAFVGTQHATSLFTAEHAAEIWPDLAARLDEPFVDPSLLPTSVLCAWARREVTVALSGDGADELFAGYDPFRALGWARRYARWVPRPIHAAIRMLATRLPTSHRNLALGFKVDRTLRGLSYPPALWNAVWMGPLEAKQVAERLAAPIEPEDLYAEAIAAWESAPGLSDVDRTLQFFTRLYLQDDILPKVDRASMQHGLEVRSPFLDIALVDLVRRIPARYKLHGKHTKWVLKQAVKPWLPRPITTRAKKGFGVPIGRWFAEGQEPFDVPLRHPLARLHADLHRRGRRDHRLHLYAEWLLERLREPAPALPAPEAPAQD
ncbi:MAG: asparagine synthase (glutamine-hydrolyzing) [Myxococcota bacterium]